MPRKVEVNKSEEIRKLLQGRPDMPVRAIMEHLDARGIEVADTLVYQQLKKRKEAAAAHMNEPAMNGAAYSPPPASPGVTIDMIGKVKALAGELGGWGTLKQLVDVLS